LSVCNSWIGSLPPTGFQPDQPSAAAIRFPAGAPGGAKPAAVRVSLPGADTGLDPRWLKHLDVGYTFGMKTAVSIPDDVFAGAERLAQRTKRSRSDIYSAAVREYIARHSGDAVTEAMNSVLDEVGGAGGDPFVSLAARNTLEQVEW
jgi:hypothetical protein